MSSLLFVLFLYLYLCAAAVLPLNGDVYARSAPRSLNHDLNARSWWYSPSLGVNLINGTPWTWKLKKAVGKLPATVEPFSVVSLASCDSDGTATYVIDTNGSPSFDIDLESYQVTLTSMSTLGNPMGATIRLGHDDSDDDYVNWVLAGNDTSKLVSTNPPKNWIQSVLPTFGNTPLSQFILPGSHDAGMAFLDLGTIASKECNTLTQTGTVLSQLETGARYFDIRPVISEGIFKSGHYAEIGALSRTFTFQGGNGESLQEIINDINAFTKDKAEIIVLRLSHDLNTDVGNRNYRPFDAAELERFYALLKTIKDLYIAPSSTVDLTKLTLNELTNKGARSAVILQFRLDSEYAELGTLRGKGFYDYGQLNAYNEFSNTNKLDKMMADQFSKMKEQRANGTYFLLSWTLTQSAVNTVSCPLLSDSIIEMAAPARKALYTNVLPAVSGNTYPQMIQIDNASAATDIIPLVLAMLYKAQATR